MEHNYELTGMHCQACVGKIKGALEGVAGVTSAEVTLNPPRARVAMSRHVPTTELIEAVQSTGEYRLETSESSTVVGSNTHESGEKPESLYPLFLIVGYIAGTVTLIAIVAGDRSLDGPMRHFMAAFFLVFSFFKFLDLRGFADAYRTYDVIARAVPAWGLIYPFCELALGLAYLVNANPVATNVATLALMLVSSIGVLKALLDKRSIRCACLGTVLNLPMTKITLVEDLGMAAMAALMLAMT
ncbi:MAG: heavy-metal-associated domain-containing protein [Deltaproteobacteria bacterium]|nr:heavy-metal-associated domain-containing protein [Deltaproteobacteria bacterium]